MNRWNSPWKGKSTGCRGLFNLQQEAFEVFPFGVADAHGMVGGMGQLTDDADIPVGVHGRGEYHGLEILFRDGLRAAEGHQQAPFG